MKTPKEILSYIEDNIHSLKIEMEEVLQHNFFLMTGFNYPKSEYEEQIKLDKEHATRLDLIIAHLNRVKKFIEEE